MNKLLLTLIFLIFIQLKTFAIDIIYPQSNGIKIYANSTFFVGNANTKHDLFLNGERINLAQNGAFVKYVPLKDGNNSFFFEEKDKLSGRIIDTLNFKVIKTKPPKNCVDENNRLTCTDKIYVATVVQDNIPLREKPNEDAKRISHLNSGTILILDGKQGDFWRVMLDDNKFAWVLNKHICEPAEAPAKVLTKVEEIKYENSPEKYTFFYKLNFPVPFIINEYTNSLEVLFYNVDPSDYDRTRKHNYIIEPLENNVLKTHIYLNHQLWGYDVKYKDGYMIFTVKKPPQINKENPLKNIKIMLDAGHGGSEPGAVGPTRVKESDINIDVARKLQKILEKAGADVVMVRENDKYVDLYDRVKMAKEEDPLFFVSIHANALPNGGNPELKHGTSVFYFYPQAKDFAHIVQKQMLKEMGTKDDGVYKRSFAVIRNTNSLSILIEMAYMVHPTEYALLLDNNFRQIIANSIKNGIENYLKETSK